MTQPDKTEEKDSQESAGGAIGAPPPSPPPPRGLGLRVVIPIPILMVLALIAGVIWNVPLKSAADRAYHAVFKPAAGQAASATEGKVLQYYTCGMHPWVVLPKPGDCPICHMQLVPLDPAKFTGEVTINPLMTQDIGVRLAPVVTGPVTREIRTVGTVDYDEKLVGDVNLKISGWISKLYVNITGQPVEKGEPLLELYSPELYSAQEEYLLAYKRLETRKAAPPAQRADMDEMDSSLLKSARTRLEFFDISQEQIRDLEKTGQVAKTMTLRSPFRGTVVAKNVVEGQKVEAGAQLLRIADLSKVWIMATIYEYQLPYVKVGQQAAISLPYVPGQSFTGTITYVYPYLNQELRQTKARLELANPNLELKPGMFARVEIRETLGADRILVPREAVIDTGQRQIAYVSLGAGRFEPRVVKVGVEAEGGMVEILKGLKPHEMVVVSGEFLLDSEARLREALAKMIQGTPAAEQAATPAAPGAAPAKPAAMPPMPGM
jgi:Cu(I)/Ag(I) efflux system membrane fusion protein/cobalt-zinc-cadmium efflux system membrane fusion protein